MDQRVEQAVEAVRRGRQREAEALSPLEWDLWRHHPVSEVLLHYLEDFRLALLQELQQRFLTGSASLALEQEVRGRALALEEACGLDLSTVQEFYRQPEEENGSEADSAA